MRILSLISCLLILGSNTLLAQKKTQIELLRAKSIKSSQDIYGGARRLIGNVKFKQDSTIMECDSAYFYSDQNMFDAFSNVHLYKLGNNNVDVKSEFLRHYGDKKMAIFRENVVLRDTQVILRTDSLDYDIKRDIGYYLHGAEIEDSATVLTSTKGHYYHHRNTIYFKDNVVVNHKDSTYQMYTDTVSYNTISETVNFFGPTNFYNDTNTMYSEFGWYNTANNKAFFKQNALYTNPKQSIEADSLFMDRDKDLFFAYSNVVATDSIEQIVLTGNYLEVKKTLESAFATDSAMVMSVLEGDTLYMHADTLYTFIDTALNKNFNDTIDAPEDSIITYRSVKAFHHVKMFKSNFQVKTDSLYFSFADSILEFHGSPVMWVEDNQITAKYIEAFIVNELLDHFKLYETGFIISEFDSVHFNQIKGKEVTGYFKKNELHRIDVEKNSETVYFPTDDGDIIGVNKALSDNISIFLKDNEPKRIIYRSSPTSTVYPLKDLQVKEMRLKDFEWLDEWRPKYPLDIFNWEPIIEEPELEKVKEK